MEKETWQERYLVARLSPERSGFAKYEDTPTRWITQWEKIEKFIQSEIDSAVYIALSKQKEEMVEKIEKAKYLEAAFSPERLREKQLHNDTLQKAINLIKQ